MSYFSTPGNKAEKDNKWEIPALLRVKLWFGLEKSEHEWHEMQTDGELAVFAETVSSNIGHVTMVTIVQLQNSLFRSVQLFS